MVILLLVWACAAPRRHATQAELDVVGRFVEARWCNGTYTLRREQLRRGPLAPETYRAAYTFDTCQTAASIRLSCDESGGPLDYWSSPDHARAAGPICEATYTPSLDRSRPSVLAPELVALGARLRYDFGCRDAPFEITRRPNRASGDVEMEVHACGKAMVYQVQCATFAVEEASERCRVEFVRRGDFYPDERFPEAPQDGCADVPVLNAALLADPPLATRVALEGVPEISWIMATAKLCDPRDQCCNRYRSGHYALYGDEHDQEGMWIDLGLGRCRGYTCDLDCEPFGSHPRTRYRFVGMLERTDATPARYRMKVERYCLAPSRP